ncbi:hypothetical protein HDU85_005552 [Gaertneriomyces sp. JEL0708]|nr:hypothetical protein HDU85_005552 [Gaertneriomyces sp. JEL0708]
MDPNRSQATATPPPQHSAYQRPPPQHPAYLGQAPGGQPRPPASSGYAQPPPSAMVGGPYRQPLPPAPYQQQPPQSGYIPVTTTAMSPSPYSAGAYPQPGRIPYQAPTPAQQAYQSQWDDSASESDGTVVEDTPEARAGPAYRGGHPMPMAASSPLHAHQPQQGLGRQPSQKTVNMPSANPNVPGMSYALLEESSERTNKGNTNFVMAILSEMWIVHIAVILGLTYVLTFIAWDYTYSDTVMWNYTCYWKLGWLFPVPYTVICFFGLALPFRTPKFLYDTDVPKRRVDNFYILTVTKGDNREAVYRSWNAHKHLERLHPCVRVHVLTDEPYFFENINCYTCPKSFKTAQSKYKARALEWYRQTMRYTEHDWVLHLDEESVIDDESVKRCLEFIWYERDCTWGQGVIMYNQYRYWTNWIFTVGDAIRVGDDLSRFQLQYTYLRRPLFGAHGSFLLSNGVVENTITWDLGSLTEDYQFAVAAWRAGYRCGKVPGIIREQSPMDLIGFLKQRRRWYVGIRRLNSFWPKLWAGFWTMGIFCLFTTVASIPLGVFFTEPTPRWFGLLKDFSFVNFVYLYVLGNLIQDIDKKVNPIIIILRIPLVMILQLIAGILEAGAVLYGLFSPPADFDVIKK